MQGIIIQRACCIRYCQKNNCMPHTEGLARRVVEQTVATTFQVPLRELRARTRRKAPVAFARQVAMYLAHVELGLSLTIVAAQFGRDRTTVSHACGRVEDRRDDPAVDTALFCLTAAIARHQKGLSAVAST